MREAEEEFESAAERELHRTLADVRNDQPEPSHELQRRITGTLRWQRLIQVPLTAGLSLIGGMVGALRLFGRGRRRT